MLDLILPATIFHPHYLISDGVHAEDFQGTFSNPSLCKDYERKFLFLQIVLAASFHFFHNAINVRTLTHDLNRYARPILSTGNPGELHRALKIRGTKLRPKAHIMSCLYVLHTYKIYSVLSNKLTTTLTNGCPR